MWSTLSMPSGPELRGKKQLCPRMYLPYASCNFVLKLKNNVLTWLVFLAVKEKARTL